MKGYLNDNQIAYVLFHLDQHIDISQGLRERFIFQRGIEEKTITKAVVFKLSEKALDPDEVIYEGKIPVIFPGESKHKGYELKDGRLSFFHDYMKSAFYLLSGYQERVPETLDPMGRFPYNSSIQSKLKVADLPLVNYYFDTIIKGIESYSKEENLPFKRKKWPSNYTLFLSHDVDIIDSYHFSEVVFKWKQVFGLAKRQLSPGKSLSLALKYLGGFMGFTRKANPAWTFPEILKIEEKYGFKSSFYFLPRDLKHQDAYYRFSEKRIQKLMIDIDRQGGEIGIHGTVNSSMHADSMKRGIEDLKKSSPQDIFGIRQHRLYYDIDTTPYIQEESGLVYDTTLGFAEHEGFRNSYCHPFRIYNHKEDRMSELWEIPLNFMDVTLFAYRKLDASEAMEILKSLIEEVSKFSGVLAVLWHNNFFEEEIYPGIKDFYIEMHKELAKSNPSSQSGKEIIHTAKCLMK